MDRKKLSEIGETVMIHLNKGSKRHEWRTEIRMSPEERRELLMQLKNILVDVMDLGTPLSDELMLRIFESEGL